MLHNTVDGAGRRGIYILSFTGHPTLFTPIIGASTLLTKVDVKDNTVTDTLSESGIKFRAFNSGATAEKGKIEKNEINCLSSKPGIEILEDALSGDDGTVKKVKVIKNTIDFDCSPVFTDEGEGTKYQIDEKLLKKHLKKARQATDKYHDVAVALADGYVPEGPCVEVPGLGGMGIHYTNSILASDLTVDELTPEILLYVPVDGGFRLVAVEYFVVDVGQPAPNLFGQTMNGPMPGHGPGQPVHYDLHVWLWEKNPNGIFEDFNPNISC